MSESAREDNGLRTHPLTAVTQSGIYGGVALVAAARELGSVERLHDAAPRVVLTIAGFLAVGLLAGALIGAIRWYFTLYRISADELRIDTGPIIRRSIRVPFSRLQSIDIGEPLVARILGLAELRMELAGGSDSQVRLRYLAIAEAKKLRHLLLERAHGVDAAAYRTEATEERSTITVVPVTHILLGAVLSLDTLAYAAVSIIALVLLALQQWWALAVFLGSGPALMQLLTSRVVRQGDFRLSEGPRGLRIERGLLSRSSQTIPAARVQGVRVDEPFVWRRLGWLRLRIDVAGYGAGKGHKDDGDHDSTLLPIGTPQLSAVIRDKVVPDADPATVIERLRPPARSWVFAPVGWRFRWVGATSGAVIERRGWIDRTTDVVPHHKVQAIVVRQGPLQRLLRLATVTAHTTPGPCAVRARHVSPADAARFVGDQLARTISAISSRSSQPPTT